MTLLLQFECTAYVHGSLFCHWQTWCSEHFERNQRAGMNELVSPYTQYLYNRFNGYDSTRSLIQNRYTACLQGLLTIIRNLDQGFHNGRIFPGRRRNCVREGSVLIACIMLSCHKFFVSLFFFQSHPYEGSTMQITCGSPDACKRMLSNNS